MERWRGKVAVVTGASAGIGAAIAENLVSEGLIVAGFARRTERITDKAKQLIAKKGKLHAVRVDMTDEAQIIKGFAWVAKHLGPVSILINNAGIAQYTTLTDGDADKWRKVIQTNVLGLCIATREAVKSMQANHIDGQVVHINSVLGHTVPSGSNRNVYPASKHAVTALTETLRQELAQAHSKIKITSVSPGYVKTDIVEASGFAMDEEIKAKFSKAPALESEDIASAVNYVLATPPSVQIHELIIKPVGEMF